MNDLAVMSFLRVRIQIMAWRHGWAWPVALLIVATTGALHWFILQPLRAELVVAETQLANEIATTGTSHGPAATTSDALALRSLQAMLGASPETAELVRRMVALAQTEQIALQQGDYQRQLHPATQLVQVRVTQPVRASYPQLRRYIESVLRNIPTASLDQVAARRENVGQTQLEARLRWSFWMLNDAPGHTDAASGSAR